MIENKKKESIKKNLREQRLRQKELEKLRAFEEKENLVEKNLSSGLQNFDVDKTKEN